MITLRLTYPQITDLYFYLLSVLGDPYPSRRECLPRLSKSYEFEGETDSDSLLEVYLDDVKVLTVFPSNNSFKFELNVEGENHYVYVKNIATGETSNRIYISTYNLCYFIYLYSLCLKSILENIGQGKANLYYRSNVVGDLVEERFRTFKNLYSPETRALLDKFPFEGLPPNISPDQLESVIRDGIFLGRNSPLLLTLPLIKNILNLQKIFIHFYDFQEIHLGIDRGVIKSSSGDKVVDIPPLTARVGNVLGSFPGGELDLSSYSDEYVYIYALPEKDASGYLKVIHSTEPGTFITEEIIEFVSSSSLLIDKDGSLTGVIGGYYFVPTYLAYSEPKPFAVDGTDIIELEYISPSIILFPTNKFDTVEVHYYGVRERLPLAVVYVGETAIEQIEMNCSLDNERTITKEYRFQYEIYLEWPVGVEVDKVFLKYVRNFLEKIELPNWGLFLYKAEIIGKVEFGSSFWRGFYPGYVYF